MISPGQIVGSYRVERLIGEGATATVYRAIDTKLKRPVAIKALKADLPESSKDRFEREVRTLVDIHHPGVVQVYDAGVVGGSPYYVMEHLQGRTLQEIIVPRDQQGRLRFDEIISLARQLTEALAVLHNARIIHRDLKPSNIIVVPPLRAILIDFGLVQLGTEARMGLKSRGLGTQAYMSPEQLEGSILDERSDVFSLGLILYEMVTGVCLGGQGAPPWFGRNNWEPPPASSIDPELPPDLENAILKALTVSVIDRVRNASEFYKLLVTPALERILPADGRLPARRMEDLPFRVRKSPTAPVLEGAVPPAEALRHLVRYEIQGLIGTGAMGEVYRAKQKDLNRTVAIKVMKREFCSDAALRVRFQRELEALARMQHPRIVSVYDVDFSGAVPFYVMEYVEAPSLSKVLAQRKIIPVDEALVIFSDLVEALGACHSRGLLHRDVKSENLLIEDDGHAKLTDFGLVKWQERTAITMDDEMIGTPSYMSPEMVAGDTVDARSDFYQAGLVLYEMIAGKRAISAATLDEIWELVLKKVPESPRFFNTDCPVSLANLAANLLEKKQADRYQTLAEIQAAVAAVRAGKDVPRRKPPRTPSSGVGRAPDSSPGPASGKVSPPRAPESGKVAPLAKGRVTTRVADANERQATGQRSALPPVGDAAPPPPRVSSVNTVPAASSGSSFSRRLQIDLCLVGALFILWIALMGRGMVQTVAFLALAAAVVDTAWTLVRESAASVVRQPVTVDNRLNAMVRMDFRGNRLGQGIERIAPLTKATFELEVGAALTFRRETSPTPIKSEVATAGLTIVLEEIRTAGRS